MKISKVIKNLNKMLKNDKDYRISWVANIAMSQLDTERWYRKEHNKVGKYLNYKDRHTIANMAAERFLNILSNGEDK